MIWVLVIGLAALAFAGAAVFGGLPRATWTLFGAVLLFGLAGYAAQGRPDQPAAPYRAAPESPQSSAAAITQRRAFFNPDLPPTYYLNLSDGFARKGQSVRAAGFLNAALEDEPGNAEAWVALGNILVEHADGALTPAAGEAYGRAAALAPDNPAPAYFLGVAALRQGDLTNAAELWASALALTPTDAAYRAELAQRVERLDRIVAAIADRQATVP